MIVLAMITFFTYRIILILFTCFIASEKNRSVGSAFVWSFFFGIWALIIYALLGVRKSR